MKRIMMLGGNYFQMTATLAAKELGYYVIDVDYLPENPAHRYADEYYNISTRDRERVLEKARELKIDGIVSYASDVSAPTAAYVAEALGLPTNPRESVTLLTHKDRFRSFLKEHQFPVPEGKSFAASEYPAALDYFLQMKKNAILKPVDSSGSKGVSSVNTVAGFRPAWEEAMSYSLSGRVLIEEFIQREGYQIDGDIFVVDGQIRFWGICDQHYDLSCSPYTPVGHSYPSTQAPEYQERARREIQRLLELLHMEMGAFNVEYIISPEGEIYLLEIGPRNGGNLISDAIKAACGVDLAAYTVKQAAGDDCSDLRQLPARSCASSYILHAAKDGIFRELFISPEIRERILKQGLLVKKGDVVHRFRNGGFGIGAMVIRFDDAEQMCRMIDHMNESIYAVVEKSYE